MLHCYVIIHVTELIRHASHRYHHMCEAFPDSRLPLSSCLTMVVGFFAHTVLSLVTATSQELALVLGSSYKTVNLGLVLRLFQEVLVDGR